MHHTNIVCKTLRRWRGKKRIPWLWKNKQSGIYIYNLAYTDRWNNTSLRRFSVCVDICISLVTENRDQINPLMFISSSLYPLASISPCSWHQLMCGALKSNLYHLNESKAPRQNSGSPISTHQLLPLKSLIIWAGLRWLVGILMWCRLLVFLFPLAASQTLAKTLVEKVITHWQHRYYLPKQWGEAAIFKFTFRVVFV